MTLLDYLVLVGYFLLMAAIGLLCMRRVKVQDDYFLGSRGIGKLLQTFAAFGCEYRPHGVYQRDASCLCRAVFLGWFSAAMNSRRPKD